MRRRIRVRRMRRRVRRRMRRERRRMRKEGRRGRIRWSCRVIIFLSAFYYYSTVALPLFYYRPASRV